jgi:transposase
VGVTPVTVREWRTRFAQEGLAKFSVVREGRGRKPGITPEQIEEIVRLTQHEEPSGATH